MRVLPLDEETMDLEIDLCLLCHPSGVVVDGDAAEEGRKMKREFLRRVFDRVRPAGFVAVDGERPVVLLELMPRDVARRSGYVTGEEGEDGEILTISCLEVAYGHERKQAMRLMVSHLVRNLRLFRPYKRVETGGFQGDVDFQPAWVYEEAGFTVYEARARGAQGGGVRVGIRSGHIAGLHKSPKILEKTGDVSGGCSEVSIKREYYNYHIYGRSARARPS